MPLPTIDSSGLLYFILEVSLKGSLVLAAAGLATSLLRRSPAAVRHTIWTSAIVAVAAIPVIVGYAPRMDVEVLPATAAMDEAAVADNWSQPMVVDQRRVFETRGESRSAAGSKGPRR